ncbi:hypothetical protein VTK56DRAFT_9161 [Thermocarpiscus australiensis]
MSNEAEDPDYEDSTRSRNTKTQDNSHSNISIRRHAADSLPGAGGCRSFQGQPGRSPTRDRPPDPRRALLPSPNHPHRHLPRLPPSPPLRPGTSEPPHQDHPPPAAPGSPSSRLPPVPARARAPPPRPVGKPPPRRRHHHPPPVSLARDIFHVRIRRRVHWKEFDCRGEPLRDPLAGVLAGVRRVATSVNYVSPWRNAHGAAYLRHLNPACAELLVLVPLDGLEWGFSSPGGDGGGLSLEPVLKPLREEHLIRGLPELRWGMWRRSIRDSMKESLRSAERAVGSREQTGLCWRSSPLPGIQGFLVDARRLGDPDAFGVKKTF